MKRIFITTLLISLIGLLNLTAQERIYAPALNLPANGAVNQMPNVVLDWEAVTGGNTGIILYDIQLDTDPAFPNPVNFQTEFLSAYQTSLLLFGQTYYWHVRAKDGTDVSGWSETWSFRVIRRVVLDSPNDASLESSEVEFKWDSISGASQYELQLDTTYYWKSANSGQSGIFYGVAALDDTHAWIAGAAGVILFFDGTSWVEQESNISTDLYDISFLDANNGWAVGKSAKITHFDGTVWTSQPSGATVDLYGVAMLDANNGWAVGKSGVMRHYNGTAWSVSDTIAPKDLAKVVAVDATHWWAVGKGGTILFNDGSGWAVQASGTTKDINGVAFTSVDHGWAVGKSGLLLEFNAGTWKIYSNGQIYPDMFSLNFTSPDNAWAVGKNGTVLQYDGIEWYSATAGTSITLNGVALAGSIGFIVGEAGTVMSFTGQAFNSPISQTFTIPGAELAVTLNNLPFGNKFYWRMKAIHQASTSEWSGAQSFDVQATVILDKPVTGVVDQNLDVLLKWKKYSDLVTYDIEIDDDPAFASPVFLSTSSISINAEQLKFGTVYLWRVRAIQVGGESEWSAPWTFTTTNTVSLLTPANGATNVPLSPPLTWTPVTGIISYEVQFNDNNSFTTPMISAIVLAAESSYFVPIVLDYDADYFWRVRAINGLDTSGWSNTWSFTTKPIVGIDEPGLGGKLSVYPNPAENTIYLQLLENQNILFQLSITDLVGKTVLNQDIRLDSGSKTVSIDVSPLREGIYMLRMSDRDSVYTKKLIIKR
jgi:photosystem II stability/assembly factor-like uncharacterized protein